MAKTNTPYCFQYSKEFEEMIVEYIRGSEHLPQYQGYLQAHSGGPKSRLSQMMTSFYPEIVYHCGNLQNKRVLDFGCGTGATAVFLASHCQEITSFDVNPKTVTITKKRLEEHGLGAKVHFLCAADFQDVAAQAGKFDFILVNAVLEHIPLSIVNLRAKIIQQLFSSLNPNGFLFITETPNRLWPIDFHTTGLWWIPWSKPGSQWAYQRAIQKGKFSLNSSVLSSGTLALEESGSWGTTYAEIKKALPAGQHEIVNLQPKHNRHLNYHSGKMLEKVFDFIVYYTISKWTKIPLTAWHPTITNLVIRRSS